MNNLIETRIKNIRNWLTENNYDAFILPHEDEYLGEYLPAHNERLHWATGFTGSAGAAVITREKAAIFVDGRYTVQVTKQAPDSVFEYRHLIEEPLLEWIQNNVTEGNSVGFDSKMHSVNWAKSASDKLAAYSLISVEENPVDALWDDRPSPVLSNVMLMLKEQSGKSSEIKRAEIASVITKDNADAAVLTQLDSICWLLNVRGLDVSRLPVLLSHAIIYADSSVDFFIDPSRLPEEFSLHTGKGVKVRNPDDLIAALESLRGKTVLLDPAYSNHWVYTTLTNSDASVVLSENPCSLPKAQKNSTEIAGMKACHIRDGAAMAKFLCWFDKEIANGQYHDEGVLSDKLEAFRREDESLVDLSFDTISAASVNAAMCHYNHINQAAPSVLKPNSMYLVDSGGQYPDGTTDITRTIAIGQPTAEMKKQFTLVLKGHIALATAKFPKGTTGHQLDILARQYLWAQGYDFDHGTGHGVGHFLNVHEGPQRIAKAPNTVALLPGMVLSNEPGYYREEEFGIRIENLELVREFETAGDFNVLGFESLTRCPIDKRNIDIGLLTSDEIAWLNNYHAIVREEVSPLLEEEVQSWLQEATAPLSVN